MKRRLDRFVRNLLVLAALTFVYFVAYPDDLKAILTPIEQVLALTAVVSPWLYVLVGFGLVAWTVVRIWGRVPNRV